MAAFQVPTEAVRSERTFDGKDPGEVIAFYYFECAAGCESEGANAADHLTVGERSIFFLNREGSILRLVHDISASRILLGSTAGAPIPNRGESDHREAIAEVILLDEGGGSHAIGNAGMGAAASHSTMLLGSAPTLRALRAIVAGGPPEAKAAACITMLEQFYGQSWCVNQLNGTNDTRLSGRLAKAQTKSRLSEQGLIESLERNPAAWIKGHSYSQEPQYLRDTVEMLTLHETKAIRDAACGIAKREAWGDVAECRA